MLDPRCAILLSVEVGEGVSSPAVGEALSSDDSREEAEHDAADVSVLIQRDRGQPAR